MNHWHRVLASRGLASHAANEQSSDPANLLIGLFKGLATEDEEQREAPTSQLFSVVMPASETFDCTVGYLLEDGVYFHSTTKTTAQP